ncbi:hypothetical protein FHY18_001616 [Xanthomonas arboricola]|uniref:TetR/AcrR family transcriptional regulator n=1 Tax=Xanthomonas sp. 3793 TaxID=3035312 RepID=UPI002167D1EA|nr:TetR/AcrR family transcriptional regulator [Xanthomonas sp. 3793]MCS3746055.1 hypothetical protein [Xanthomonas sp. 3793]
MANLEFIQGHGALVVALAIQLGANAWRHQLDDLHVAVGQLHTQAFGEGVHGGLAIAKKAGVGQGTFCRHFPTREALVIEVYRHEMLQVTGLAE